MEPTTMRWDPEEYLQFGDQPVDLVLHAAPPVRGPVKIIDREPLDIEIPWE
jgi:hypothetical protein